MIDAELRAIRERAEKATAGPWVVCRESNEWGTIGMPVCRMDDDEKVVVGHVHDWGPTAPVEADAAFIAASRSDVPALLGEVGRLRSALRDAHAFLARLEAGAVGGVCRVMFEAVRERREAAAKALGENHD